MKFKNVLCCTMAILPMFCAIESQAGLAELAEEYNKAKIEERHNSEAYKNTQKLNEKQKDFLLKVMYGGAKGATNLVGICYQEYGDLKNCHDGTKGFGWELPFPTKYYDKKYISNIAVSNKGSKSIVEVKTSSYFGENVTLVLNCEAVVGTHGEYVDCPISSKSTCLEKGLCSAGIFDVGDESAMIEIEYKIKD